MILFRFINDKGIGNFFYILNLIKNSNEQTNKYNQSKSQFINHNN